MRLKMHLVRLVKSAKGRDDKQCTHPGWALRFLPEDHYSADIVREDNEEGIFVCKTHYRGKDDNINTGESRYYVPAFELCPDGNENIEAGQYALKYGTIAGETEFSYIEKVHRFIVLPPEKKDGQFDFKSKAAGAVGAQQPGYVNLYLYDNEGNRIFRKELHVLPSSLSREEMEMMIQDIFYIRREFLTLPKLDERKIASTFLKTKRRKIKWDSDWNSVLDTVNHQLDILLNTMKKISLNPHGEIKHKKESIPSRKLKGIDSSIVRQYCENQTRRKYQAKINRLTYDIFEHRFLYRALSDLQRAIEKQSKTYRNNVESEKRMLLKSKESMVGKKDLDDYIQRLDNTFEEMKQDYRDKFDKEINRFQYQKGVIRQIEFEFRYSLLIRRIQDIPAMSMTLEVKYDKDSERYKVFYTKAGNQRQQLFCKRDGGKLKNRLSQFIFKVSKENIQKVASLYYALETMKDIKEIKDRKVSLKVSGGILFQKAAVRSKSQYDFWDIIIDYISEMYLDGTEIPLYDKNSYSFLQKIYIDSRPELDKILLELESAKSIQKQTKNNERTRINESVYDSLIKKIVKCKALNIFQQYEPIDVGKQNWRITQIFTNDYNYHKAYMCLLYLDVILDFSTQPDTEKIFHQKLDKLYEYWILTKMIEILLMRLRWEADDGANSPLHIINRFWTNKLAKYDKENNYPPITFHRTIHGKDFRIFLYYDTKLRYSLQKEGTASSLQPDFLLKIKNETAGDEKVFVLDAKYRNYKEQGDEEWLQNDLGTVCRKTYMERIRRELDVNISAAYIVHTDMTEKSAGAKQPNAEAGQYVTFNSNTDERCKALFDKNYPGKQYPIGSFYLVPITEDKPDNLSQLNLETFFKMVFEYYFDETEVCWHCGSENVKSNPHYTEKGNMKYYMTCQDCGSFWVRTHCQKEGHKLIKRMNMNYHTEDNSKRKVSPWYVKCPICDAYPIENK